MSKLNIDQNSIKQLFEDKKSDFIIPDYQRPYAWGYEECQTLWEDIFDFAFPDNDSSKFNGDEEYYLGPIVTFKNDNNKLEIIDGQQRLTTLMLLLRAFYEKLGNMQDPNSIKTKENIEKCIWKTDEFGNPNKSALKIDSEVATDEHKEEFLEILRSGNVKVGQNSRYAKNYRFFQEKINDFINKYPSYFSYLPTRILNNCILLPIEADDQNTALRIFSTLNDRGKPLSDSDIFKAQLYKYYSQKNEKKTFIEKWRKLEETCEKIFKSSNDAPMDELFTRYMYYERAKMGIKLSTTEALRKFYERDSYALLRNDSTLENLITLADFWSKIYSQDENSFNDDILRRLFVLNYAPNSMWTYFLSVYFMKNRDSENRLDNEKLLKFLNKTIGFIWTYAVVNPGVNALRTPVFAEMVNIVNDINVEFNGYKFSLDEVRTQFENYNFNNNRPITKSMLAWWAFENDAQEEVALDIPFEIEHIYARNRNEKENGLTNIKYIDLLGNKSLLEKKINIRASDYRFEDKKKFYLGFTKSNGERKEGTSIVELRNITQQEDFTEKELLERNKKIIDEFLNYLERNELKKQ